MPSALMETVATRRRCSVMHPKGVTYLSVALLLLLDIVNEVRTLRLTNMTAPLVADPREDMHLDCHFDMGAEVLYAVKWYKDEHEFFRYMPHRQPHEISFPVDGVRMIPEATSCGENRCQVRLTGLTRSGSGGAYRCEVSSEAPAFRLASETHKVTVAAVPRDSPRISGIIDHYSVGDPLSATCSSPPSDPPPSLVWYINNQQAQPYMLGETTDLPPDKDGLVQRSSTLRLIGIERKHLQGSVMHLRCEASLPGVPVQPRSVGQTIIVRTRTNQINNEKYHWPNSSCLASQSALNVLLALLVTSARWKCQN